MAITSAGSTAAPMETRGLFATIDDEFVTNMTTVLVPLAASATGRREPVPRRQAATKFASFVERSGGDVTNCALVGVGGGRARVPLDLR